MPTTMDQVVWAQIGIHHDGENRYFKKGDLLPPASDSEEASTRNLLRIGGAVRTVEVVYTPDELAAQAQVRAETTARHEAAPAVPAGPPTLTSPAAAPVVVGDEELRAEHEQAKARRGVGGKFTKTDDKSGPEPAREVDHGNS